MGHSPISSCAISDNTCNYVESSRSGWTCLTYSDSLKQHSLSFLSPASPPTLVSCCCCCSCYLGMGTDYTNPSVTQFTSITGPHPNPHLTQHHPQGPEKYRGRGLRDPRLAGIWQEGAFPFGTRMKNGISIPK